MYMIMEVVFKSGVVKEYKNFPKNASKKECQEAVDMIKRHVKDAFIDDNNRHFNVSFGDAIIRVDDVSAIEIRLVG